MTNTLAYYSMEQITTTFLNTGPWGVLPYFGLAL
jgi:hypothetical protein